MNKEQLAQQAQRHHDFVVKRRCADVENAVSNTHVYREDDVASIGAYQGTTQRIDLVDMDTVSAAFEFSNEGKVALLNFASYKNPGGNFIGGSSAQEEMLCHSSCLYEVLKSFESGFYARNRQNLNGGLYTNAALYSSDVWFQKGNQAKYFDVLTCASPNLNAVSRYVNKIPNNVMTLRYRARFITRIASAYGPKVLILGAWGCGVFKQDPQVVAQAFKDALQDYYINHVVFAVPNDNANYEAFAKVLFDV